MQGTCLCGCGTTTEPASQNSARRGWVKGQPVRYAPGHWARHGQREPLTQKWTVDETTGCWVWQRARLDGYGYFKPVGASQNVRAHRYIYEHERGSIGSGLTLDHLCRNRACVNPDHLEPVTIRENTLRGNTVTGDNA